MDRAALVRRTFAIVADAHPTAALPYWQAVPLTGDEHARTAPERTALAEKLLTRLLRDGAPKTVTPVMTFLRALALTPAEQAPFLRDHVALLDLSSPVAAYGQEVLRELDEAGLLEEDVLSEACERVLLRPEKKLVRAQLSWLDRVARREPARAGRISVCAALAFGHPDVSVQERALTLVARHLKNAGDPVRAQLRTAAAASLGPALAARAAQLLGAEAPGAGHDTGAERVTEAEVLPHLPGSGRYRVPWGRPSRSPRSSPWSSSTTTWWRSSARWTGWSGRPGSTVRRCPGRSNRSCAEHRASTATAARATCTTWRRPCGVTSRGDCTAVPTVGSVTERRSPRPGSCSWRV
ncbi:hypothetical protein E5N77_01625 [Streptomyces sp. SS52]|nr:hypothetical protein E5N77_01625 [Streptomyces sp. SS52]